MQVVRDHVLTADAHLVNTNIGNYVSLDYDGVTHPVDLNTRLPDGTLAFPPITDLKGGTLIRVTYDAQLGVDPLISSSVPRLVKIQILGVAPLYRFVVEASAINTAELEDPNQLFKRIQDKLSGTARVVSWA